VAGLSSRNGTTVVFSSTSKYWQHDSALVGKKSSVGSWIGVGVQVGLRIEAIEGLSFQRFGLVVRSPARLRVCGERLNAGGFWVKVR
jgi:hypothetical protein